MKKRHLSLVASLLLTTSVQALTVEISKGWNLFGASSAESINLDDFNDSITIAYEFTPSGLRPYDPINDVKLFTSLESGNGYWIRASKDFNITLNDSKLLSGLSSLDIGWNLVAGVSKELSSVNVGSDKRIDIVYDFTTSGLRPYDPINDVKLFTSLEPGKGYWFKISKKLKEVTTLDGYTVTLYSSASETVPSSLADVIKSSTLNELTSIPDWENVTSVVIGSGSKTKEYATTSIADVDMGEVKSELAGTTVATASLYIYGVSEGSAPYALVDALVYKVESDGSTTLVGTTDTSGFITAPTLTNGTKLLIKKDGMTDKVYTIEATGTNYIFMTEDNALELPEERASTTSSSRVLDYISETFKLKDNIGYYAPSSSESLKKDLPVRRIKPAPVDTLDESDKLKSLIDSKAKDGYKSDVLASFDFYLKISKRLGGKGYGAFSDYYPTEPYITVALPGADKPEIEDAIAKKGGEIRVFYFDGTEWKERTSADLNITTIDDEITKIKKAYARKFDLSTPVLEIKGTGFYPHVVVLDKKVSFRYPVRFHVTDSSNANLSDAAVFIGDRLIGTTDANGYVDYNITAGYSDVNFYVKAMKTDYKSADKTVYISSLKEGSDTTIDLKLEKISTVGSVEGFVYDTNETNPVYLSKVDLYFPYALAYVKADAYRDGKLGVEVGNQPNTKYKWYMKIHEDTPLPGLARISKKRWLLVKEGSSSDNGNFLSYQDMKRMIAEAKDSTDPEDVKSMVSGLFDIAVIAEHDIDGDGSPDLVELSTTEDEVKTDFTSTYASDVEIDNYAKIVGTVKFDFDVEKFAKSARKSSDEAPAVKVDGSWYTAEDDYDDYSATVGLLDEGVIAEDYYFKVDIDEGWDYFDVGGLSSRVEENDYTLNYGVAITADLMGSDPSDDSSKKVMLVKDGGRYSWKLVSTSVLYYEIYKDLYDNNASMTIATKVWDATDNGYVIKERATYKKISKFISQNEIMEKLNMTLSQIADEAGASDTVKSAINSAGDAEKPLISTGMDIIPMVDLHTKNHSGKDIILVEGERLQQGAIDDITSYIMTGEVNVNPPVSAPRVLVDTTDRSGKFIFSKLPLEYAKLGDKDISMLTLGASKYAHYNSAVLNVAKYSAGKVKNIKINLKSKGIATVNVEVKDADTNASIEANVTIDGQYKEVTSILDNFKEYTSLESKVGSKVVFDDIISGLRTISIVKDGYYPQAISKTVYKDNENNVTVYLKQATALDGVLAPSLGLDSFVSDEVNGIIKLELVGFDKSDGTLAKDRDGEFISKLIVYNNGEKISPKITMNADGHIDVVIDTPKIGKNEIVAKLINPKGESATSPLIVDFYPSVGSIRGSVSDFTDEDMDSQVDDGRFVVVNLYDDKMNYIQSVMTGIDGSYMVPMAPIGSVYLKALQINGEYGTIEKESDFTNAVVAVGSVKKVNLKLNESSTTTGWVPVVDYDPSISEKGLESEADTNGGQVTIKGEVKWFDPKGQLAIMVNYTPCILNADDMSAEDAETGTYNFTKDVNLSKGLNEIVVKALNPSGFYDTTPILEVNYGSVENYLFKFEIKDDANNTIPYAHVEMRNPEAGIYRYADANESGELMDELPYTGTTYDFEAFAPGYMSEVIYESNFATLDGKDGSVDKNITITFHLKSETYIPKWYIEGVSYTQELPFDIPDGVVVKDKDVTFNIKPSDENAHDYYVAIRDEFGGIAEELNVTGDSFNYKFDKVGNYEVEIVDKDKKTMPYMIYINVAGLEEVLPEPPVAPVIPTPSI